jgi:hypothetical protein
LAEISDPVRFPLRGVSGTRRNDHGKHDSGGQRPSPFNMAVSCTVGLANLQQVGRHLLIQIDNTAPQKD